MSDMPAMGTNAILPDCGNQYHPAANSTISNAFTTCIIATNGRILFIHSIMAGNNSNGCSHTMCRLLDVP